MKITWVAVGASLAVACSGVGAGPSLGRGGASDGGVDSSVGGSSGGGGGGGSGGSSGSSSGGGSGGSGSGGSSGSSSGSGSGGSSSGGSSGSSGGSGSSSGSSSGGSSTLYCAAAAANANNGPATCASTGGISLDTFYQSTIGNGGCVGPYKDTGGTTITVESNQICACGTSAAASATAWGSGIYINLSESETPDGSVSTGGVTLSGSGLGYAVTSVPDGLRVQLCVGPLGPQGCPDDQDYCVTVTPMSGTIPWTDFRTYCWTTTGVALAGPPANVSEVQFQVPTLAQSRTYDFCVTALQL